MPQQPQAPPTWSTRLPLPYGGSWSEAPQSISQDSEDRTARRRRRIAYELGSLDRAIAGKKPSSVVVQKNGEVDAACQGKNAWDEAIRNFTPKFLDMSVVAWSKQAGQAVKRLREVLDNEFEYLGHTLSMVGFRQAVTRYMKAERSRLKTKWLKGHDKCPLHIDGEQWLRLINYWKTDAQVLKAQQMAVARQSVKNYSQVGRKGKAGKEAAVVSIHIFGSLLVSFSY